MRRISILAAAVGGLLVSSSAFGAFSASLVRTAITSGAFAGNDRVNLIITGFDNTTALGGADINIDPENASSTGVLRFNTSGFAYAGNLSNPADFSLAFPNAGGTLPEGSYGGRGTFGGLPSTTTVISPEPNAANKPNYTAGQPRVVAASPVSVANPVRVTFAGFFQTPIPITGGDAPNGVLLASAVVPSTQGVNINGIIEQDLVKGGPDSFVFNLNSAGAGGATPAFGAGSVVLAPSQPSTLTTTGDNPTIYTLTIDFGNLGSVPAAYSIDTNMTESGTASVGALPSGITAVAAGDVISGTVAGNLRGTFDIPLTGSGSPADTAILRIVAIPEPATLSVLAGVGLLALRRRK